MTDIWCTVPWHCDEKDCPHVWHRATYWTCDCGEEWCEGYTYDSHSDGDHEHLFDETPPDERPRWAEYSEWVIENREDPLGEFIVRTTKSTLESWECVFMGPTNPDYEGPANAVFLCARRGRGEFTGAENLPNWLKDYLGLTRDQPEHQDPLHPICGYWKDDWEGFVKAILEPSYDPKKKPQTRPSIGHWKGRVARDDCGAFDGCVLFSVVGYGVTPRKEGTYEKDLVRLAKRHVRKWKKEVINA